MNTFDDFFDFNSLQASINEITKNIIKEKDVFILNCFLKHGFDYKDIIENREKFNIISFPNATEIYYKGELLFKIRETLVSNVEADILSNGLSFKTYLEEVLDE